jgi:hypothetical protein
MTCFFEWGDTVQCGLTGRDSLRSLRDSGQGKRDDMFFFVGMTQYNAALAGALRGF